MQLTYFIHHVFLPEFKLASTSFGSNVRIRVSFLEETRLAAQCHQVGGKEALLYLVSFER